MRSVLAALALLWITQGDVQIHPETGERYVLQRPAEGSARGRWSVPSWVVWAIGGSVATAAGVVLGVRARRKRS